LFSPEKGTRTRLHASKPLDGRGNHPVPSCWFSRLKFQQAIAYIASHTRIRDAGLVGWQRAEETAGQKNGDQMATA
jgi:hypothetical protein